jgi:hypothetical protein
LGHHNTEGHRPDTTAVLAVIHNPDKVGLLGQFVT